MRSGGGGDAEIQGVREIPLPRSAPDSGEAGYNPLFDPGRPQTGAGLNINKKHTSNFYEIVESCGIKINEDFFLQMIAPDRYKIFNESSAVDQPTHKNLPTYLFVNDNNYDYVMAKYNRSDDGDEAMEEDEGEQDSYYPAILYTNSIEIKEQGGEFAFQNRRTVNMKDGDDNQKLVFMDMEEGLTGDILGDNSRKPLSSYKNSLIEDTNKLINQLLKNAEPAPSKNKIAQIFENPSDNCKEALKKICEKYNSIKTDDGVLIEFVREDTGISGGYGSPDFLMPDVVEIGDETLSQYGSIAKWALGPQDDRANLQGIFDTFSSSSTFPKPDLPRLENFKFSAMPDGSIYVEEKSLISSTD